LSLHRKDRGARPAPARSPACSLRFRHEFNGT
jgi:hypothetical protein